MQYLFKQAVFLSGKSYPRGLHELSEKVENDPHFLKFVGAGFIVDPEAEHVQTTQTLKERSEALLNKVMGKKKISKATPAEPVQADSAAMTDSAAPAMDASEEETDFMEAPSKSKKKR